MTFLTDKSTADMVDTMNAGDLLRNVRVTPAQAADALAYLQRHCEDAEEIGRILGVIV